MRPAIVALAVATAAFVHPAAMAPVFAQTVKDGWVAESSGPEGSRTCLAIAFGETEGESLMARGGELGVIEFEFTNYSLKLPGDQPLSVELLVDGRKIDLAKVIQVTASAVQLVGAVKGRLEGSILRAVEEGQRAVVQLQGIRSTVSLVGSRRALERLSQCAANGGRMPNEEAQAANTAPPQQAPAERTSNEAEPRADEAGQVVVGDWIIYPSAPHIEGGCFAARTNAEGSVLVLHQEQLQAGVTFGIGAKAFDLGDGWRRPAELVLDGQPVPFLGMRAFDRSTLISSDAVDAESFHARLRTARTAAFTYEGETFRFDLSGFAAAIPAFARCVAANDKTFASVMDGNRVNRALGVTLPPEAATGTAANETDDLEARDVEEEEEQTNTPGVPGSMAAQLSRPRAFAQLRCSIPEIHMMGLYGANAPPFVFDISVNADASANVSGAAIAPIDHSAGNSGPSMVIYRASAIYGAANRSPIGEAFKKNMHRPPEDAFGKAFAEMLANPGSMVPENRVIAVSLDNNDATVADQLPGGGFGAMTTHRCRRIR